MSSKELELFNRDDITFEWNYGIQAMTRIKSFLLDVDSIMTPQLVGRVDIEDYSRKLAEKADNLFLVYHLKDIAGCSVYCNSDVAYISSIAVKNEYQNSGIGDLMMSAIKKHVKGNKINSIRLHVHKENDKAISYYIKNGFTIIERDNNWIEMETIV